MCAGRVLEWDTEAIMSNASRITNSDIFVITYFKHRLIPAGRADTFISSNQYSNLKQTISKVIIIRGPSVITDTCSIFPVIFQAKFSRRTMDSFNII